MIDQAVKSLEQKRRQLQADLSRIEEALAALRGLGNGHLGSLRSGKRTGKRKLSPEGRAAIIAAQKKRWAKHHAAK